MEQLASPLVEKLLDYTVNAIGRQLGYLIFYRKNIEVLKNQVEELKHQQATLQHSIDEATRNGEIIEDIVKGWMNGVDEMRRQAEQFYEEESQARTECRITSCPNLCLRYQLSKKAKKMGLEVVKIQDKKNFDRISYLGSPNWMLDSTNDKSNKRIDSRVQIMNQLMEALRDPNVNMIGLCGLGGVGKTTIAKEVAKKVKDEKMFEKVIMAIVSDDLNLERMQLEIAEMLGMKLEDKTESIRASRLIARLKQEKNLLIILDDLWETLDLSKVGIPYIDDGKHNERDGACKILLTSRDEKLLSDQMKCERNIKVGVLSDKEAWELFKRVAEFSTDSNSPALIELANEIVQKCQGLPLAIDAIARALRNKGPNEWNDALKRLKNPLRRNITGIRHVDSILKFSYDHLSLEHQPIFVLSAMLSHDPSVNDLLMYSVGLDLLRVQNMEEAQYGIFTFISKLKASSLLLDSFSNNHFTMHDVIRDVTLSIASNEKHFLVVRHRKLNEWPNENSVESYIGICIERSEVSDLPEELHGPTLELFLLNSIDPGLTIPSTFFKSTKLLKVLGFTRLNFSSLPSLRHLVKLKTLCLHSCLLEDITEVGNLRNLKILSLAYSEIEQLPFELAQLTCLQMLNLANCPKLSVIPPKLLSSLKRLEVLCMENSFNQWKAEGSCECNDNASLGELKNLPISSLDIHIPDASVLPKDLFLVNVLERYRIFIGEHWEWSGYYETLKTLKLKLGSSIHLELAVQKLLEKVEDLHLEGSNGLIKVLCNLDGRGFPHLKHLDVEDNDDIEYVVLNSTHLKVAFPILETLRLQNLKGLKKLCQGPIAATFFQNLKVIKVRSCDQLKNIFPISMVEFFSQLVEIEICDCKSMEEIVIRATEDSFDEQKLAFNVITFHQLRSLHMRNLTALNDFYVEKRATNNECNKMIKSLFNSQVSFPKLEKLKLSDLNKLIPSIWDDRSLTHSSFSNLKTMTMSGCGFVKLVPFHVLKSLNYLEELLVEGCDMLEMVFDFEELNSSKEAQQSSSLVVPLKKLSLESLPKLKHVWSNDPHGIVSFPSLRHLHVDRCNSLTSMFPASIAKGCMLHLEKLRISHCGIEVIVAKNEVSDSIAPTFVFDSLINLELEFLPNLKNFYPQCHTSEWPHLQGVSIVECEELEIFENEASSSSEIQEERTPDLKYSLFSRGQVSFPKLEELKLIDINKLIPLICDDQHPDSSFSNLKTLTVERCGFVKLVPLHVLKSLNNLEELQVEECDMLEMVFDFEELNSFEEIQSSSVVVPLKTLSLESLPKLKHVWSNDPQGIVSFQSLRRVEVSGCESLTSMFPASIAKGCMLHLEQLDISDCGIEVIVAKDEVSDSVAPTFVFHSLINLELRDLPNLKNFYPHSHTSKWPRLQQISIIRCEELDIFENEASSSSTIQVERTPDLKYPLFSHDQVILDLKEMILGGKQANKSNFSLEFLKRFPNLEKFIVDGGVIEEIFISSMEPLGEAPTFPVPELHFLDLKKMKHIWNEHSPLRILQCLQTLRVSDCDDLISLGPSFISLANLTYLDVSYCKGLTSLLTSSTGSSLAHLSKLTIWGCERIEEIITKLQGENDVEKEIIFSKLGYLGLDNLPRLKSFCSHNYIFRFPLLDKVIVKECPRFKIFCPGDIHAPLLKGVEVAWNQNFWDTNLNNTIQQRFTIKEVISKCETLG